MSYFMDVVIQSKDRASKQEGLRDIHQSTIRDVLQVEHLNKSKCNAAND